MVEERPQVLYLESNAVVARLLKQLSERQFGNLSNLNADIVVVEDEIAARQLLAESPSGYAAIIVDDARGAHASFIGDIQRRGFPFSVTTTEALSFGSCLTANSQPLEVFRKPGTATEIVDFISRTISQTAFFRN